MDALPTISSTELIQKASAFAKELARRLEDFNSKYPGPKMSMEAQEYFDKQFKGTIPDPRPDQLIPLFERIFCSYVASQRVIRPG